MEDAARTGVGGWRVGIGMGQNGVLRACHVSAGAPESWALLEVLASSKGLGSRAGVFMLGLSLGAVVFGGGQ